MYEVWCMMYDVWCMMYDVWCMMYDVWCMMYDVWCMMYDVWCMMYDVVLYSLNHRVGKLSGLEKQEQIVKRAFYSIDHVCNDVWWWYMMCDVWCVMCDVWCVMCDVWYVMCDMCCVLFRWHQQGFLFSSDTTFGVVQQYGGPCGILGSVMYDVWCMMYDVWCMMYDVWCMMYDVWYMMYDVWCMMYDGVMYDAWTTAPVQAYILKDIIFDNPKGIIFNEGREVPITITKEQQSTVLNRSLVAILHVWCMMYDVWCMMYDVWCMMYDVWCMMYDVWCMMYDVWCMMYDVWYMIYDMYDIWCMMDVWCRKHIALQHNKTRSQKR